MKGEAHHSVFLAPDLLISLTHSCWQQRGGIWLWKLWTTSHPFQVIFKPFGHTTNPIELLHAEAACTCGLE